MREHFVDVCDPEANVPRPADIVRLPGHDLLPAGRIVKGEQFQKQILRSAKRNLQETNAHIDGFRILQKTGRPRESRILEVRKGLLNARIKERFIKRVASSRSGTTTLMCPGESNENMRALKFEA
jgi:hypothetical protein